MTSIASVSEVGLLVGEPARTAMLVSLMDGRSLAAGELARAANVAPATASGHLARLVQGGLLKATTSGRHRYFRLASPSVARMIEGMMGVAGVAEAARRCRPISSGPADRALRRARRCYDHLAGDLAVRIAVFLEDAGHLEWTSETGLMTPSGLELLTAIGVDLTPTPTAARGSRGFCRPCMDWSERRLHVAGAVGRSLMRHFLDRHWLRPSAGSRVLAITPVGAEAFARHFGVTDP